MKAFPEVNYVKPGGEIGTSVMTISGGMNLRDYFAAKAMQADIGNVGKYKGMDYSEISKRAYEMADSMMKAREQ